jgi:hypothetical protein
MSDRSLASLQYRSFVPVGGGVVGTISVGTAATRILESNTARKSMSVMNNGTSAIYIGFGSTVGTNSGFYLPASQAFTSNVITGDIYGVIETGSQTVSYMEL